MRITNKYNLPQYLVNVLSDTYPARAERLSVTDLINPPLIRYLQIHHWDKIEVDVSERLTSLLGKAAHKVMEEGVAKGEVSEEKLEITERELTVVGKFDRLTRDNALVDFKFTSAWSFVFKQKDQWQNEVTEWEKQLNVYDWLLQKQKGQRADKLVVAGILRDWSKKKAKQSDYPDIPFGALEVPHWNFEQQDGYVQARITQHLSDIEACGSEGRWAKDDEWAVKKKGNKNAKKVCESKEQAEEYIRNHPNRTWEIEYREGEYIKCKDYCLVRHICPYNPYADPQNTVEVNHE